MNFVEFSFWLSKEMKRQGIPGSAALKFIDINFSGVDEKDVVVEYDKESNSVQIRMHNHHAH